MKIVIEGTPEEIQTLLGKQSTEVNWTEFKQRWLESDASENQQPLSSDMSDLELLKCRCQACDAEIHRRDQQYASYNYYKPLTDHPGLD